MCSGCGHLCSVQAPALLAGLEQREARAVRAVGVASLDWAVSAPMGPGVRLTALQREGSAYLGCLSVREPGTPRQRLE